MKKIIIWILMILIVTFSCGATGAIIKIDSNTNLALNAIRYDPFPAEPGKLVDVWLRVTLRASGKNVESSQIKTLEDVEIALIEQYPFSAYSNEEKTKSFSTLLPGDVLTMKFKIRVDSNAPEGSNELRFKYRSKDQKTWVESAPMDIHIGNVDAVLGISEIKSEPEKLNPGEKGKLTIKLKNHAKTSIKDITLNLDLSSNEYFSPIGSTTKKRITSMMPGEEKDIEFEIMTLPETLPNAYTLSIEISYHDVSSNTYFITEHTGLIVNSQIDYLFNLEGNDILSPGVNGKITLSISNIGLGDLKFLTLNIEDTEDYKIIGKKNEYLGNLESDDFETSEFEIYIKPDTDKSLIPLKFTLNYKDTFNQQYIDNKEINLPIYNQKEIRKYGLTSNSRNKWNYLFYILIILWLYFVIVEYKEKESLAKSLTGGIERLLLLFFRIILFWTPNNMRRIWRKVKLFFKKL